MDPRPCQLVYVRTEVPREGIAAVEPPSPPRTSLDLPFAIPPDLPDWSKSQVRRFAGKVNQALDKSRRSRTSLAVVEVCRYDYALQGWAHLQYEYGFPTMLTRNAQTNRYELRMVRLPATPARLEKVASTPHQVLIPFDICAEDQQTTAEKSK